MAGSLKRNSFENSIKLTHRACEECQRDGSIEQDRANGLNVTGSNGALRGNNFLKGAKWSPDGKIILSCSDDGIARLYATPPPPTSDIDNENATYESMGDEDAAVPTPLLPWVQVDEGETIFDFCWYPLMDWAAPSTCYFALSARDHPIHLYNPHDNGFITYSPLDAEEELSSFVALAFHPLGSKLFGGNRNSVSVYDISRPGKPLQEYILSTRRSKGTQRGIISCFAFQPPFLSSSLLACGSYGKSVHLYDEACQMSDVLELHDDNFLWGGVTQLQWYNEHMIISGHRQDCFLRFWDIRKPLEPLHRFTRSIDTNQRFAFDIYKQFLITGEQSGNASVHSLDTFELIGSKHLQESPICSTMMHPHLPWLLTASGTRIFTEWDALTSGSSDNDERQMTDKILPTSYPDNSVSIWSLASCMHPSESSLEIDYGDRHCE
ncbi:putative guanine nucleotide-binding protein [Cardiosporidium cionae]|uniref:Guanine nucleotide-binding protein n=1 Tax=Cardiosporidium cionae TaxID=476202 RepID=A0ABQ7J865_9APIC|nr:putative guanine nucleotide-binding protein [Cardiosporidium cionae]|eukprot:KAF8820159.1 putative guanine nucleotide-binding protein [Cardiosporidium cionae]